MRAAWRIAAKDLVLRLRDRSAVVIGVVVPLALAFVFNLVFGGAFGERSIVTLGYADTDQGQVAAGLSASLDALAEDGVIDIVPASNEEELRELVAEGQVSAGLLVPAGLSEAALAGNPAEVTVVGDVGAPTAVAIARGIAAGFATGVEDAQRAVTVLIGAGDGPPDPREIEALAQSAAQAPPVATIGEVEAADRVLDPATFFAASMAVFFVFFMVQFGVTGLLEEEREGTLPRLQAAPIARWSVVVGKALTSLLLGVSAMVVLAVATTLLMGAEWGNPIGVAVLIVTVVLAATSIIGLVAGVTRTPEGAGNIVAVIAVAMGMLGGTFFPVGGNAFIETLSLATPHAWFLRGLGSLHAGGGIAEILPAVAALLAFGFGVGAIASVVLKRRYA